MDNEEETEKIGRFFLYLITAVIVLLALAGCATSGKTVVNEESIVCIGFCAKTEFESKTEIAKE